MPSWQSYSFLFGPLMVGAILLSLVLALRWAFGRGGSLVQRAAQPGEPGDYGVLVPVDAPTSYLHAGRLQAELTQAGIESTLAQTTQGLRVLVWPEHAEVARAVVRRLHRGPAG